MKIKAEFYDQIVAHALKNTSVECCGLVAEKDGEAQAVYPCVNAAGSWSRGAFQLDPMQQHLLLETMERDGHTLGAIYHSHPSISAVPSTIDEGYAKGFPGVRWIIVSFTRGKADVWTWRMNDGEITTAELIVEGSPKPVTIPQRRWWEPRDLLDGFFDEEWERDLLDEDERDLLDENYFSSRTLRRSSKKNSSRTTPQAER